MAKLAYLTGIADTLTRVGFQGERDFHSYIDTGATYGEAIAGVDKTYEDSANVLLPIIDVLSSFTARSNGMPPEDLEKELARLRLSWRQQGRQN
jgi:hypothetical protein